MCLAQGHNTVTPVRLKPAAPRSRVKHTTTEPLWSNDKNWPVGYKAFSISTQLSMKFQLLIKPQMVKNKDISCYKTLKCIYPAINVKMPNIYKQDKFHALLS